MATSGIPEHCGRAMSLSFIVGARCNFLCASGCGHRAWSGPLSDKPPHQQPDPLRLLGKRHCRTCGGDLTAAAGVKATLHKRCWARAKNRTRPGAVAKAEHARVMSGAKRRP